jgi:hypothetical protein
MKLSSLGNMFLRAFVFYLQMAYFLQIVMKKILIRTPMTQEIKPSELLFKVVANEIGWLTDIQASNGEIVFTANGELTEAEAGAVFLCKTLNNFYPLLEACKEMISCINDQSSMCDGKFEIAASQLELAVKNAEAQGARDE